MASNHVNLFWTGGYDSTFRLLQLVLEQGRTVQPHYIIDPTRQSLRNEVKAIREIKSLLFKRYPSVKGLILSTIIVELSDITPDVRVEQAYQELTRTHHIESQYIWLSRYCKQHHIYDMEVCIQVLHNSKTISSHYYLEPVPGTLEYRIMDDLRDGPVGNSLREFSLPQIWHCQVGYESLLRCCRLGRPDGAHLVLPLPGERQVSLRYM